jgi:hypothetical protein
VAAAAVEHTPSGAKRWSGRTRIVGAKEVERQNARHRGCTLRREKPYPYRH